MPASGARIASPSMSGNALQWGGSPGHYEVYYLSATDPGSGVGVWIRYTMLAPLSGEATCSLWFMVMDPREPRVLARKATLPIASLHAGTDPFELTIGDAVLSDRGMSGAIEDARWDLHWEPGRAAPDHVHALLRRAKIAKTVLVLPQADVDVGGTLAFAGREIELAGARGGQAHLWGSKHAARWAWAHGNDFLDADGAPVRDTFLDGVSVFVPRLGREVGPSTPVVGRFLGEDFASVSPARVLANDSTFDLTSWELEARDGKRRIHVSVSARREDLVGVTYHDPDGDLAYCYNTEVASMRIKVSDRAGCTWTQRQELVAPARAHFEYAQREPLPEPALSLT